MGILKKRVTGSERAREREEGGRQGEREAETKIDTLSHR